MSHRRSPVETIIGHDDPEPTERERFVLTEWLGVDGDATYRVILHPTVGDPATSTMKGEELSRVLTALHRGKLVVIPDAVVGDARRSVCTPTVNVARLDYYPARH